MAEQSAPSPDILLEELKETLQVQEHAEERLRMAEEQQPKAEDPGQRAEKAKVGLDELRIREEKVEQREKELRLLPTYAPSPRGDSDHSDHSGPPLSDVNAAARGHKRNHSQVTSSPPQDRARSFASPEQGGQGHAQRTAAPFCTQRCLLGLQKNDVLDDDCPKIFHAIAKDAKLTDTW